jgi:hypothetical protein
MAANSAGSRLRAAAGWTADSEPRELTSPPNTVVMVDRSQPASSRQELRNFADHKRRRNPTATTAAVCFAATPQTRSASAHLAVRRALFLGDAADARLTRPARSRLRRAPPTDRQGAFRPLGRRQVFAAEPRQLTTAATLRGNYRRRINWLILSSRARARATSTDQRRFSRLARCLRLLLHPPLSGQPGARPRAPLRL